MTKDPTIECIIVSCSLTLHGSLYEIKRRGWRGIIESKSEPGEASGHKETNRTHLGFCPNCSLRFGVDK